mgnify:CR=1 FL=1|jgi:hypothetical protein|tara:strand:+ start:235 stop:642 length:408 start_codon:yes stop_codon:yes gene_type:complete
MIRTRFPRIQKVWEDSILAMESKYPGTSEKITAQVTPEAGLRGRNYGFFDDENGVVGLSPRLEAEPIHRIEGIVRHELGHACDHFFIRPKARAGKVEARADNLAKAIWGSPITYDTFDVQTSKSTEGPRPAHLHK